MFGNIKVATRLALGFGLTIVLMLIVAFVGGTRMEKLNSEAASLATGRMAKLEKTGLWEVAVLQTARHMRNVFLLPHDEIRAELESIHRDKKERAELLEYMVRETHSEEGKASIKIVVDARTEYIPWEDEFLKLAEAGELDKAKVIMLEHARPTQLKYVAMLAKLREHEISDGHKQAKVAAEVYASGLQMLITLSVAAALIALVAGIWITRSITRPLEEAVKVAQRVAAGDLTGRVEVTTK